MQQLENSSFCCGVLYGLIAAAFIGMTLNKMRESRIKAGLQDRSMNNFPDAAQPNLTSAGVVRTSQTAQLSLIVWSLVLITIIGMALAGLFYLVGD